MQVREGDGPVDGAGDSGRQRVSQAKRRRVVISMCCDSVALCFKSCEPLDLYVCMRGSERAGLIVWGRSHGGVLHRRSNVVVPKYEYFSLLCCMHTYPILARLGVELWLELVIRAAVFQIVARDIRWAVRPCRVRVW